MIIERRFRPTPGRTLPVMSAGVEKRRTLLMSGRRRRRKTVFIKDKPANGILIMPIRRRRQVFFWLHERSNKMNERLLSNPTLLFGRYLPFGEPYRRTVAFASPVRRTSLLFVEHPQDHPEHDAGDTAPDQAGMVDSQEKGDPFSGGQCLFDTHAPPRIRQPCGPAPPVRGFVI